MLGMVKFFQEKRLAEEIADIEKYTGYKLRVLAQNYPDTPGLLNVLKGFGIHQAEQFAFVFLFQIWIDARKCSLVTQSNTSGCQIVNQIMFEILSENITFTWFLQFCFPTFCRFSD